MEKQELVVIAGVGLLAVLLVLGLYAVRDEDAERAQPVAPILVQQPSSQAHDSSVPWWVWWHITQSNSRDSVIHHHYTPTMPSAPVIHATPAVHTPTPAAVPKATSTPTYKPVTSYKPMSTPSYRPSSSGGFRSSVRVSGGRR